MSICTTSVVYHYNPTSNRNFIYDLFQFDSVVYHYNPTSNRNIDKQFQQGTLLYIIIILHQTATNRHRCLQSEGCISL